MDYWPVITVHTMYYRKRRIRCACQINLHDFVIPMLTLYRCVVPLIIINYLFDNLKFLPELYAKLLTQSVLFYLMV